MPPAVEMKIERMEYRPTGGAAKTPLLSALDGGESTWALGPLSEGSSPHARVKELEQQLRQVETARNRELEEARAEAHARGRRDADQDRRQLLEQLAGKMGETLNAFVDERDHYFSEVEQEVVRLALAIARRIMHREAQMDPLLLSGAVRVALGQLADGTAVTLRVPASEKDLWEEMLRLCPNLSLRPQLAGEAGMRTGECLLETRLGEVNLGIGAQLDEIERGFFDLLETRPQASSDAPAARRRRAPDTDSDQGA
jgi:flagellar assembly protein FliH